MLGSRGIWRKIKSIGKGSFGQVYLVRRNNDTSSKMFVMKEVRLAGLPPKELSAAKAEVALTLVPRASGSGGEFSVVTLVAEP